MQRAIPAIATQVHRHRADGLLGGGRSCIA